MVRIAWLLSAVVGLANGLGDTDTITWGGDNSRAGYQTNHNMDPAIIRSSQFDQLFRTRLPGDYAGADERVFSQPLVYTPSGSDEQFVYLATTQNNVYKIDAQTGEILLSRNLHIPFLTADLDGCVDINPTVGVTGTGVIDPETDTYYILAKTYEDQEQINVAQGRPAGRYYLHAIDVNDLSERPNFPVNLEGIVARNNPERSFNGGIHLQRPGLLQQGNLIYAGLGSHCVKFNFTGWIMGWDKTSGDLVEHFATQGEGVVEDEGAGIWMAGGGLAADDAGSIFFATGNGYASQLSNVPVNGREPPTALEQAVVHMSQQDDGTLEVVDFFMPWDKQRLDEGDIDLGSSPLQILPSDPFSCGDVRRIGMVTGKDAKTYWLNLDDLGGYRQGGIGLDKVLQVYEGENSVYAGAGVYPLEGGFVYVNPVSYPSVAFQFSCTNGVPTFSKVGETPESNGGILGVSHGTVTSLDGQPGTGLLWTTDINNPPGQLRIYDPVPRDGQLQLIRKWELPGVNKFSRAVFGDGILYLGSNNGWFHGFGAPVQVPINCTSPLDFGSADIESTGESETLTCTAIIDVEISDISLRDEADFAISDVPTLPLTLTAGQTFTLNANFSPRQLGFITTDIAIESVNSEEGYRTTTSIRLTGEGFTESPSLSVSPRSVSFDNVIAGNSSNVAPQTVLLRNRGNSVLTVTEVQYSTSINGTFESFDPSEGTLSIGPFTIRNLPATIDANSDESVTVSFNPADSGTFSGHIRIISDGGNGEVTMNGRAGPPPVALIEFQSLDESEWIPYETGQNFTFGNVTENTTKSLRMRITNAAPEGAVRLSLTVSKAPFGSGLIRAVNQVDLGEGTNLAPGESATAVVYCSVPRRQWNLEPYDATAFWFMNTNDPSFRYHDIQFACNAVSPQAPPLLENGVGQYQYIGCFKENNPGRQLERQLYSNPENTVAMCIEACAEEDLVFCGNQYRSECWAGNTIPRERVDDANCNFYCAGAVDQICGGDGVRDLHGGSFISLFADTLRFDGNQTNLPPLPEPQDPVVNPGVEGYAHVGCYTEAPGRTLPSFQSTEQQTVQDCIEACDRAGYGYAGLEFGGECWCGNAINPAALPASADDCSMPCNDNRAELCGGPDRLNIYHRDSDGPSTSIIGNSTSIPSSSAPLPTSSAPNATITSSIEETTTTAAPAPTPEKEEFIGDWQFQGCYTEGDGVRALGDAFLADDDLTLEACAEFCSGHQYFGAQYSRECWCGNALNGGSDLAANQDDCNMPCAGDGSQFCGAGNRLELYIDATFGGSLPSSEAATSGPSSAASSAIASSPSSAASSPVTSSPSSAVSSDAVSDVETPVPSSSLSGNATSSAPVASPTLSSSSTSSTAPAATPSVYPGNEEYVYAGCYSEPSPGRLLPRQPLNDPDEMSIDLCIEACAGAPWLGVEYGQECWCGEALNLAGDVPAEGEATPGELVDDEQCSFVCPGNGGQFCGAGVRMSVYVLRELAEEESTA